MIRKLLFLNVFSLAVCFSASATETKCQDNSDCPEVSFCKKPVGACENEGICELKPEICTMDYTPVCGCDKKSYSNVCNANSKGISVLNDGECK